MASDLKIDIDDIRLNVRVGLIIRHNDDIVVEISTEGRNSVIPGGRIKINEQSSDALVREIKEEMNFVLNKDKLKKLDVFENFFSYENKMFHEIYFLYEYVLDEKEFIQLNCVQSNYDNKTTYFKFVSKYDLEKYNLLPLELHKVIKQNKN